MRQKTIFNVKSQQNQSHSSVSQLRFILHAKVLTGKTMHMCFLRCSSLFPVGVPEILILYRHLWSQTAGIKMRESLDGKSPNPKRPTVSWVLGCLGKGNHRKICTFCLEPYVKTRSGCVEQIGLGESWGSLMCGKGLLRLPRWPPKPQSFKSGDIW